MKIATIAAVIVMAWSGAALASSAKPNGTFELMGKQFCFANAPSSAHCDYRFDHFSSAKAAPAKTAKNETAKAPGARLRLWGTEYCLGAAAGGQGCDRSVAAVAANTGGKGFDIFGFHVCFGKIPTAQHCDLRFPPPQASRQLHARR